MPILQKYRRVTVRNTVCSDIQLSTLPHVYDSTAYDIKTSKSDADNWLMFTLYTLKMEEKGFACYKTQDILRKKS